MKRKIPDNDLLLLTPRNISIDAMAKSLMPDAGYLTSVSYLLVRRYFVHFPSDSVSLS